MERSVLEQAMQALETSEQQIVQLLIHRSQLALRLAQASPPPEIPITREERVSAVVGRLLRRHSGPLDRAQVRTLFALVVELTEPLCIGLWAGNGVPKKG
jgi:chorismate mutase